MNKDEDLVMSANMDTKSRVRCDECGGVHGEHSPFCLTLRPAYLSVAETARLLRPALAAAFPGTKFSVRSSSYSGGASIRVHWTDGPRRAAVDAVAQAFAGATFDGMIDLKSYHTSKLVNPDGTCRTVYFGADFIFCDRDLSDRTDAIAAALAMLHERCVLVRTPGGEQFGNRWVDDLASAVAHDRDYRTEPDLERAFRRVVFHEETK